MQNRRPSRPRKGDTLPAQGDTTRQEAVPRLPHEHDESADSQPSREHTGKRMGALAHHDEQRGAQDTSKAPEMDRAYGKLKK